MSEDLLKRLTDKMLCMALELSSLVTKQYKIQPKFELGY